ncbi:DUF3280 domain-containing protein [Methylibium sp.]|uniref:DUF3280 domain-containing protein n=1 Tax=Methylibium sp. TaxID=2067992 RepID=UPI0017B55DE2|nr:DUF3280 domain-containing protein [Methylibium sp.]MBA3590187.1 DUF3280 domain-containing protein [Methylibium sp.]
MRRSLRHDHLQRRGPPEDKALGKAGQDRSLDVHDRTEQKMKRSFFVGCLGAALLVSSFAVRAQAAPPTNLPSIAVLNFELVDDNHNPATKEATQARLVRATAQLQEELNSRGLYRVVDAGPSQDLQAKLRSQQAFLYQCTDCVQQVGKLLGADLVMTTWVQKVSELILNLNVEIHDIEAKKVVLTKSVDMRSNVDESWNRAVSYLVRDMVQRRAKDPQYGL